MSNCAWCGEPITEADILASQVVIDSDGDEFHFLCKALEQDEIQEGAVK